MNKSEFRKRGQAIVANFDDEGRQIERLQNIVRKHGGDVRALPAELRDIAAVVGIDTARIRAGLEYREIELAAVRWAHEHPAPPEPITQAEFARISGLSTADVSRRAGRGTIRLTREHAEQTRKQREGKRESRESKPVKPSKGKRIYWMCKGCGETVSTIPGIHPTCPTCNPSPGFDKL